MTVCIALHNYISSNLGNLVTAEENFDSAPFSQKDGKHCNTSDQSLGLKAFLCQLRPKENEVSTTLLLC